jgi:hypothetical protein
MFDPTADLLGNYPYACHPSALIDIGERVGTMVEKETLSESIRRKVLENKVQALNTLSDCETTEVSGSHMRTKNLSSAATMNLSANPLLPVCIGLAIALVALFMFFLMRGIH